MTNRLYRRYAKIRKSLGGSWRLAALAMALFSGVLYAGHPLVHAGLDLSHGTQSQSSVPDHCTLCQPNQIGTPAQSAASLLETIDIPTAIRQLYVSPFRVEEHTAGSISTRAPPFPPSN